MSKRLILLLLSGLCACGVRAQEEEKVGTYYGNAIPAVLYSGKNVFMDVRDTRNIGDTHHIYTKCRYASEKYGPYHETQGNAVYYRLVTSEPGDITIHNRNSLGVAFTTVFLLRAAKPDEQEDWEIDGWRLKRVAMFEEMDFMLSDYVKKHYEDLWGIAYLRIKNLPPGSYYVVSAGYKYMNSSVPDGFLGTTILIDFSANRPGRPKDKPLLPNNSSIQYRYDQSGNRIKTIKTK